MRTHTRSAGSAAAGESAWTGCWSSTTDIWKPSFASTAPTTTVNGPTGVGASDRLRREAIPSRARMDESNGAFDWAVCSASIAGLRRPRDVFFEPHGSLRDAMAGIAALFARGGGEAAWAVVDPVLRKHKRAFPYGLGSWVPDWATVFG